MLPKIASILTSLASLAYSFPNIQTQTGCQLEPVQSGLNNKTFEIYTYKYSDGLHASNIFSAVRHEGCSGGGACVWTFTQCDYSADHEGGIYVLKNKKYNTY